MKRRTPPLAAANGNPRVAKIGRLEDEPEELLFAAWPTADEKEADGPGGWLRGALGEAAFCASLRARGFAFLRFPRADAELFAELDRTGRELFSAPQETLAGLKSIEHPDQPAWFSGFRQLRHRSTFRVRRVGSGVAYPWPSERPSLAAASMQTLERLERVAYRLARATLNTTGRDGAAVLATHVKLAPSTAHGSAASPLDLFHYPNSKSGAAGKGEQDPRTRAAPSGTGPEGYNCCPHPDPGLLSIALCSPDPGLLVQDARNRAWQPAHAGRGGGGWVENDTDGAPESGEDGGRLRLPLRFRSTGWSPLMDACVLAGESMETLSGGDIPAGVHAVSMGSNPRLSVVYELQTWPSCPVAHPATASGAGGRAVGGGAPLFTGGVAVHGLPGIQVVEVARGTGALEVRVRVRVQTERSSSSDGDTDASGGGGSSGSDSDSDGVRHLELTVAAPAELGRDWVQMTLARLEATAEGGLSLRAPIQ